MKKEIIPAEKFLKDILPKCKHLEDLLPEEGVYQNLINKGETNKEITQRILDFIKQLYNCDNTDKMLFKYNARNEEMLIYRYGLLDNEYKTLDKVALKYKLNKCHVSEVLNRYLGIYASDCLGRQGFLYTKKEVEEYINQCSEEEKKNAIYSLKGIGFYKPNKTSLIQQSINKETKPTKTINEKIKLGDFKSITTEEIVSVISGNQEFKSRVYNVLLRMGLHDLSDLLNVTEEDFLKRRGVGPRVIAEIKNALNKLGLKLKSKVNIDNVSI